MDSTISVSKGCFAFKKKKSRSTITPEIFSQEPWYKSYLSCWSSIQETYKAIENEAFSKVLEELVSYVSNSSSSNRITPCTEIPAAALLLGVNMPDHASLFSALSLKLAGDVTPHVATLWSRNCTSIRLAIERMCSQFMSGHSSEDSESSSEDDSDEHVRKPHQNKIQRTQCNLPSLSSWYKHSTKKENDVVHERDFDSNGKALVVIIPDIESFPGKVLEDFVLLLSGYLQQLPFFLVLGVATNVSAIHRSLPHHVSSCVNIKLFHIKPSSEYLSEILEKVFLIPQRRVHLGGRAFELLSSVFLCYDFSVTGFVQGYKYCLTQHFYGKNYTSLCCSTSELPSAVKKLSAADVESLRELLSARKYVEENLKKMEDKRKWITDDKFMKNEVNRLLLDLHMYVRAFYLSLRCLHIFSSDLPSSPIGKNLESIYATAISSDLTKNADFVRCVKLFSYIPREEFQNKLDKVLKLLQEASTNGLSQIDFVAKKLEELSGKLRQLCDSSVYSTSVASPRQSQSSPSKRSSSPLKSPKKAKFEVSKRSTFREKLKESATLEKQKQSPYEALRGQILDCLLEDLFSKFLVSPCTKPLHEVMFYNDDKSLKAHIVGSPRQAVFRALRDPFTYLQCQCCKQSSDDEVLQTLPDISIVYKLHLESGRLINMFDWLQSFLTVVNPTEEEQTEVDPKLQARFTQAVAELQFLGFIKSSSRKTDHVTRLTWG